MSVTAAVILAGGRGERLGGVIKANLEIGGERLLVRVSRALGSQAAPVVVSHGMHDPALLELLPGQLPAPDLPSDYAGPLAGLAGAIEALRGMAGIDRIVSVAVDTPFLPADFVTRLDAALTTDVDAAVAHYRGQDYPTNAIWRLSALAGLPEAVRAGTAPHSLRRLAGGLKAGFAAWDELAADPFANLNTPADRAALEHRSRVGNAASTIRQSGLGK